jgi:hypothetical protein
MSASRTLAFGAAAIGVLVLALVASVALRERPPLAASPGPTASSTATASATPTNSPASVGGRYVSTLGYTIETPPPWHLTTCTQRVQGVEPKGEVFVPVPARDETGTDIGPQYTTLMVISETNPQGLTPRQWAERRDMIGGTVPSQVEDVTYAGRPAARKTISSVPGLYNYFVADAGRMYQVGTLLRLPLDATLRASLVRMIDSFQFISDAERAAARAALPTPAPSRTPEALADALGTAFAAKDTNALVSLATPCIFRGGENAGGTTWSREKYLDDLRAMFASGLVVTVQARPFDGDRASGHLTVMSTWQDSRGTQTRKMVLQRGPNDRWEWAGTIERYS